MSISDSKYIEINDCIIHDGFSINKEMINISELSDVKVRNITIYDIYSHKEVICCFDIIIDTT